MNDGDPPLHWDEAKDPPPHDFSSLLIWLRETYCLRLYVRHGLPIPPQFAKGSQKMVATCLKRHGFRRGSQSLVSRMEKGSAWPGTRDVGEKGPFLYAAADCYGIKGTALEDTLTLALVVDTGVRGLPQSLADKVFKPLDRNRGGTA